MATKPKKMQKSKFDNETYFACTKCNKIVLGLIGALTHAIRKHGVKCKNSDIEKYFKVVKNPPQEIVDQIQSKKIYQAKYYASKKGQTKTNGVNYKCNACELVVGNKQRLYRHCEEVHGKKFQEIGCTETNSPRTHRAYSSKKSSLLPNLMGQMPQVVDITDAQASEDGFIITVRLKISTAYVAAFILPTLSNV